MKPNSYIHTPLSANKKLFLGSVPGGRPGEKLLSNFEFTVHDSKFKV